MLEARAGRTSVVVAVLAALLGGCAPGAPEAADDTSRAPGPSMADPDPKLLDEYRAAGLDEDQSLYLAMTELSGTSIDERTAQLTATFPTGNDADITITMDPDVIGDPDAPPHVEWAEEPDGLRLTIKYFVADGTIPPNAVNEPRGDVAAADGPVMLLAVATSGKSVAAGTDGTMVIVEALVKQFNSHSTSEFVKIAESKLGGAELNNLIKAFKAQQAVIDALAASKEYQALVAEIDALESCARNPTNPITQRAYEEDPDYLNRILDQISATREELTWNTAASFLSQLIKTGSSLISGVRWLGYVVGPGTAWSKSTLAQVNRTLIDDLRKNITPCEVTACLPAAESTTVTTGAAGQNGRTAGPAMTPSETDDPCQAEIRITYTSTSHLHASEWTITGSIERWDDTMSLPPEQPVEEYVGSGTYVGRGVDGLTMSLTYIDPPRCEREQLWVEGKGEVWLDAFTVEEGWFGAPFDGPAMVINVSQKGDLAEGDGGLPYLDLIALAVPLEGGTATYPMVIQPEAECGEEWARTITITYTPSDTP